MRIVPLKSVASVDISNVDKKCKDGEEEVFLCNFVDVYHNWAITRGMESSLMRATASKAQIERFSLHKGQVAITKDSETRDDIGIPAYIADDISNGVLGYHCALITPDETALRGKYLNIVLHSPYAKKYFEANASGSGQRYTLTIEIIERFPIPLPDEITAQDDFGNLCSAIDSKIANNNAICFDLESMAKLLYDYWFVQFDFPDEHGKPYRSSSGKMVWNDALKREIPEGWEVHRASEYISPVRGVSYSAEDLIGDGIPMFNLNSFNEDGTYKTAGLKTFSGAVADDRLVAPHDLIMCVTQQTDIDLTGKRNVIGKALFVPDLGQSRMTMSMDVVKLVADDPAKLAFFKYLFGLGYAHKYVVGYANGTKIKHLDIDGALSVPVAIPPKSSPLIQAFYERALTVSDAISNALNENQRLAEIRDFLLPMLMNGQVTVGKEHA